MRPAPQLSTTISHYMTDSVIIPSRSYQTKFHTLKYHIFRMVETDHHSDPFCLLFRTYSWWYQPSETWSSHEIIGWLIIGNCMVIMLPPSQICTIDTYIHICISSMYVYLHIYIIIYIYIHVDRYIYIYTYVDIYI